MTTFRRFVDDYRRVRLAEGQASTDPSFARRLPFRDTTGRNAAAWRVRALHYLVIRAGLAAMPGIERVLDLGAGNGWLARRLAGSFRVTAVDVDGSDTGLSAIRDRRVTRVRGDLELLPLRTATFDAAIVAAALHYAVDPGRALAEAARVLRPRGLLVIADSPLYPTEAAREDAHARTRAHYAAFGAAHLADRYRGLTRAALDAPGLFRFITVAPGFGSWRAAARALARRPARDARLPILFGRKR